MAAVDVPVTQAVRSGNGALRPTQTNGDSVNGHTATNNGNMILEVENTGGSPATVTVNFSAATSVDGQTVAPEVSTIANGTARILGPWPVQWFGPQLSFTTNTSTTVKFRAYTH